MLGILVKRGEMVTNYWIGCQGALFSNKPTWEMVIWNVSNGDRMGNQWYRKCVIVHSKLWNDHKVYYGIIMRYWVLGVAVPLTSELKKHSFFGASQLMEVNLPSMGPQLHPLWSKHGTWELIPERYLRYLRDLWFSRLRWSSMHPEI